MRLPKKLTTVTLLSKALAIIVFITLPFIGFFLGIQYQETLDIANKQQAVNSPKACTEEAKVCPDGSRVGRQSPSCDFTPCPTAISDQADGKNLKNMCEGKQGNWSENYKECMGLNKKMCESLGGNFVGCASPCRHNPKAEMCAQVCVEICEF